MARHLHLKKVAKNTLHELHILKVLEAKIFHLNGTVETFDISSWNNIFYILGNLTGIHADGLQPSASGRR